MACTCDPSTWQEDCFRLEASLGNTVSSRPANATQWDPFKKYKSVEKVIVWASEMTQQIKALDCISHASELRPWNPKWRRTCSQQFSSDFHTCTMRVCACTHIEYTHTHCLKHKLCIPEADNQVSFSHNAQFSNHTSGKGLTQQSNNLTI